MAYSPIRLPKTDTFDRITLPNRGFFGMGDLKFYMALPNRSFFAAATSVGGPGSDELPNEA